MEIIIKKLSEEEIKSKNITKWPIWTKEVSTFDWFYDEKEECLFLEGKVIIHTDSDKLEIQKGDYAVFPKGLSCKWEVIEPIKKYYKFS